MQGLRGGGRIWLPKLHARCAQASFVGNCAKSSRPLGTRTARLDGKSRGSFYFPPGILRVYDPEPDVATIPGQLQKRVATLRKVCVLDAGVLFRQDVRLVPVVPARQAR